MNIRITVVVSALSSLTQAGLLAAMPLLAAPVTPQQSVAGGFQASHLSEAMVLPGDSELSSGLLETGDVDEDGDLDLVGYASNHAAFAVFLNTGMGQFAPPAFAPSPVHSGWGHRLVDVNRDGHLDLLASDSGSSYPPFAVGARAAVLLGSGDGHFGAPVITDSGPYDLSGFDAADLDDDGLPDFILVTRALFSIGLVGWQRGLGDGSFGPVSIITQARTPGDMLVTDLDADGRADIVFVDELQTAVIVVLRGLGGGAFADAVGYPCGIELWGELVAADMDADGHLDLLKLDVQLSAPVEGPYPLWLLRGLGDGSLQAAVAVPVEGLSGSFLRGALGVADLDRDGFPDLIGLEPTPILMGAMNLLVQRMGRGGPIGPPAAVPLPGIEALAVGDFDADGLPDVVAAAGSAALFFNALGPFIDIGYGKTAGIGTPALVVSGSSAAGGVLRIGVRGLPPLVSGLLFIGSAPEYTPFKGGMLVPSPDVLFGVMSGVDLELSWPAGIPIGTAVFAQAVMLSGSGLDKPLPSNAVVLIAE